jgi:hypothetical protein
MNRQPQHTMYWVILALLDTGFQVPSSAQEKITNVTMRSEVRMPRVPVLESSTGVSVFELSAMVNDKGEGQGTLTLDLNPFAFDEFGGARAAAADLAVINLEFSVKFVKMGKVRLGPNPPRDEERFLYEIAGKNITSRFFLVTAGKKLGAERNRGWLLVQDKQGRVTHLIGMFPPDISPCHPGCFPAGTLVQTPTGTRTIDSLRAGDAVTIVRLDGAGIPGRVQSVFITENRLLKVETEDGHLLTTETQPLCLVDGTTQGAGELKAGDRILRWKDGKRHVVKVRAVTPTGRLEKVFNLILGDAEVFIAGGFLARSKPPALALSPPAPQLSLPDLPGRR